MEKKKKRLSIGELKAFKGLENLSDEQASEAIDALESLSILFFELYKKHKVNSGKIRVLTSSNNHEEQRDAA